jgi:hypothetical protein
LFLDDFEGISGLLGCGLVGFEIGYSYGTVFGCYGDFWVKA